MKFITSEKANLRLPVLPDQTAWDEVPFREHVRKGQPEGEAGAASHLF